MPLSNTMGTISSGISSGIFIKYFWCITRFSQYGPVGAVQYPTLSPICKSLLIFLPSFSITSTASTPSANGRTKLLHPLAHLYLLLTNSNTFISLVLLICTALTIVNIKKKFLIMLSNNQYFLKLFRNVYCKICISSW